MISNVKNFCDLARASYSRKWVTLSILIGFAAGLGSIIFKLVFDGRYSYSAWPRSRICSPMSTREGATVFTGMARPWVLPFLTAAGGLLSGLIVLRFAPEAKGPGHDAVINAFHNKEGVIRRRVPVVKAIASAITIGSGGCAGREGPTAQIAAGIASMLADLLTCSIAYFVTGGSYIFESQVNVRAESPAHRHEYSAMLLKALKVKEAMINQMPAISSRSKIDEVADLLKEYEIHAVPVVDEGKLVGIVAKLDMVECIYRDRPLAFVKEIMSTKLVVTYPDESLFDAMNKMIINHISQPPVVERDNPDQLLGLLALDDATRIQCTTNAS